MKFEKIEDLFMLSLLGKKPLSEYSVVYTAFNTLENPTPENILSQFTETIISKNFYGVKEYIQQKIKINFPEYIFQFERMRGYNQWQSNEVEEKNILILCEEIPANKKTIDVIVLSEKN